MLMMRNKHQESAVTDGQKQQGMLNTSKPFKCLNIHELTFFMHNKRKKNHLPTWSSKQEPPSHNFTSQLPFTIYQKNNSH